MALVRTRPQPLRTWTRGNLFDEFDRFFEELATPFVNEARKAGYSYPIDLYETDDTIVFQMATPGLRADAIDVSVEGRQLTIRANLPEVETEKERRYWFQGIPRGDLSQDVRLPGSVDVDNIEAQVVDGLLTVTMPKVAEAKVKKIAVTSN